MHTFALALILLRLTTSSLEADQRYRNEADRRDRFVSSIDATRSIFFQRNESSDQLSKFVHPISTKHIVVIPISISAFELNMSSRFSSNLAQDQLGSIHDLLYQQKNLVQPKQSVKTLSSSGSRKIDKLRLRRSLRELTVDVDRRSDEMSSLKNVLSRYANLSKRKRATPIVINDLHDDDQDLRVFFRSPPMTGKNSKINVDFLSWSSAFSKLSTHRQPHKTTVKSITKTNMQQPEHVSVSLSLGKPHDTDVPKSPELKPESSSPVIRKPHQVNVAKLPELKSKSKVEVRKILQLKIREFHVLELDLERANMQVKAFQSLLSAEHITHDETKKAEVEGWLEHALRTIETIHNAQASIKQHLKSLLKRLFGARWSNISELRQRANNLSNQINNLSRPMLRLDRKIAVFRNLLNSQKARRGSKNAQKVKEMKAEMSRLKHGVKKIQRKLSKKNEKIHELQSFLSAISGKGKSKDTRKSSMKPRNLYWQLVKKTRRLSLLQNKLRRAHKRLLLLKRLLADEAKLTQVSKKSWRIFRRTGKVSKRSKKTDVRGGKMVSKTLLGFKEKIQRKDESMTKDEDKLHKAGQVLGKNRENKKQIKNLMRQELKIMPGGKIVSKKQPGFKEKLQTKDESMKSVEDKLHKAGHVLEKNRENKKQIKNLMRQELKIMPGGKIVSKKQPGFKEKLQTKDESMKSVEDKLHKAGHVLEKNRENKKQIKNLMRQELKIMPGGKIVSKKLPGFKEKTLRKDERMKKVEDKLRKAGQVLGKNRESKKQIKKLMRQELQKKQPGKPKMSQIEGNSKKLKIHQANNLNKHVHEKIHHVDSIKQIENEIEQQEKLIQVMEEEIRILIQEIDNITESIRVAKLQEIQANDVVSEAIEEGDSPAHVINETHNATLLGNETLETLTKADQHNNSSTSSYLTTESEKQPIADKVTYTAGSTHEEKGRINCDLVCLNSLVFKVLQHMVDRSWGITRRVMLVLPANSYRPSKIPKINITGMLNLSIDSAARKAVQIVMNVSRGFAHVINALNQDIRVRNSPFSFTNKGKALMRINESDESSDYGFHGKVLMHQFDLATINRALIDATKRFLTNSKRLVRRLYIIGKSDSSDDQYAKVVSIFKNLDDVLMSSVDQATKPEAVARSVAQVVTTLVHVLRDVITKLSDATLHHMMRPSTASSVEKAGPWPSSFVDKAVGNIEVSVPSWITIEGLNRRVEAAVRSLDKWSRLLYRQTVSQEGASVDDRLELTRTGPDEAAKRIAKTIIKIVRRLRPVISSLTNMMHRKLRPPEDLKDAQRPSVTPLGIQDELPSTINRIELLPISHLLVSGLDKLVLTIYRLHKAVHVVLPRVQGQVDESLARLPEILNSLHHVTDEINAGRLITVEAVAAQLGPVLLWSVKNIKLVVSHLTEEFKGQTLTDEQPKILTELSMPIKSAAQVEVVTDVTTSALPVETAHQDAGSGEIVGVVHIGLERAVETTVCQSALDLEKQVRLIHGVIRRMLREHSSSLTMIDEKRSTATILLAAQDVLDKSVRLSGNLVKAVASRFHNCKPSGTADAAIVEKLSKNGVTEVPAQVVEEALSDKAIQQLDVVEQKNSKSQVVTVATLSPRAFKDLNKVQVEASNLDVLPLPVTTPFTSSKKQMRLKGPKTILSKKSETLDVLLQEALPSHGKLADSSIFQENKSNSDILPIPVSTSSSSVPKSMHKKEPKMHTLVKNKEFDNSIPTNVISMQAQAKNPDFLPLEASTASSSVPKSMNKKEPDTLLVVKNGELDKPLNTIKLQAPTSSQDVLPLQATTLSSSVRKAMHKKEPKMHLSVKNNELDNSIPHNVIPMPAQSKNPDFLPLEASTASSSFRKSMNKKEPETLLVVKNEELDKPLNTNQLQAPTSSQDVLPLQASTLSSSVRKAMHKKEPKMHLSVKNKELDNSIPHNVIPIPAQSKNPDFLPLEASTASSSLRKSMNKKEPETLLVVKNEELDKPLNTNQLQAPTSSQDVLPLQATTLSSSVRKAMHKMEQKMHLSVKNNELDNAIPPNVIRMPAQSKNPDFLPLEASTASSSVRKSMDKKEPETLLVVKNEELDKPLNTNQLQAPTSSQDVLPLQATTLSSSVRKAMHKKEQKMHLSVKNNEPDNAIPPNVIRMQAQTNNPDVPPLEASTQSFSMRKSMPKNGLKTLLLVKNEEQDKQPNAITLQSQTNNLVGLSLQVSTPPGKLMYTEEPKTLVVQKTKELDDLALRKGIPMPGKSVDKFKPAIHEENSNDAEGQPQQAPTFFSRLPIRDSFLKTTTGMIELSMHGPQGAIFEKGQQLVTVATTLDKLKTMLAGNHESEVSPLQTIISGKQSNKQDTLETKTEEKSLFIPSQPAASQPSAPQETQENNALAGQPTKSTNIVPLEASAMPAPLIKTNEDSTLGSAEDASSGSLDVEKVLTDRLITLQDVGEEMLRMSRLMSEVGQSIYWSVMHAVAANHSTSISDSTAVETIWKEYMNGLLLEAGSQEEKYELLNKLSWLSKKLAVKLLRLYSAIYKSSKGIPPPVDYALRQPAVEEVVSRQSRNFFLPGPSGLSAGLFACEHRYVDYAVPDSQSLVNQGVRLTVPHSDRGYVVSGLTSLPHGSNSDVALELVFAKPVRIVGIVFPRLEKVKRDTPYVSSVAVYIEQQGLRGTWTPIVDAVSKNILMMPVTFQVAALPSLLQYKPLVTRVRLYPQLWTASDPLLRSPMFVVCRLPST